MLAANSRGATTPCPQCRKPFRITVVKQHLLASSLINELEIFCSNRSLGCEWKGPIERATAHLGICAYGKNKVPAWLEQHQKAMEMEE